MDWYRSAVCLSKTAVESVKIPGTVETIGIYIFSGCENLKNVSVDEGITYLPKGCFSGDIALEEISLPLTLKQVGDYALDRCEALSKVNYSGTKQQWELVSVGENNDRLLH